MNPLFKRITMYASVITAIGVIMGAAAWAADTRYHTLEAQKEYVIQVAEAKTASEVRQLKRDIKRLQIKVENGSASAEDKAFIQYLQQDLEDLQPAQ